MLQGGGISHDEACEATSGSGTRQKSAWRGEAREVTVHGRSSFAAEEADAAGEGSATVDAVGKEVGGVEVIVDVDPVFAAGDVVEAAADGPVIAEGVESFFDVCIQREPRGEAARARGLDELLLIVDDVKGESGADLGGIGEIETFHEREQAVGEEAVRSVPRVGTELLGAELRVVDVEVEDLVGTRAGADV